MTLLYFKGQSMTAEAYAAPRAPSPAALVPEPAAAEADPIIFDPMDEDGYMNSDARYTDRRRRRQRRYSDDSSEISSCADDSDISAAAEQEEEADAESSDYNTSGSEWAPPASLQQRTTATKRKKPVKKPAPPKKKKQTDPQYGVPLNPADDPNYRPFAGEENVDWTADDGVPVVRELMDSSDDPCTESEDDLSSTKSEAGSADGRIGHTCTECNGRRIVHFEFEISADGVTMQKKALKDAFWPLMGQLISVSPCKHVQNTHKFFLPRNSKPIVIGFYHGSTKPQCANEYLACVFKEMQLADKHRICTSYLKFFIGDGPARQFIKGFPSHAAYCGCERYK
jgi:hypothetical protein